MIKKLIYIIVGLVIVLLFFVVYIFLIISRNGFGPGLADYTYKIAGSCRLSKTSAHNIIIGCDGIKESIGPEIVRVGWDEEYLVVITHPNIDAGVQDVDCASCTYWWIQDLKKRQAYGPMKSEEEFNKKKNDLGVANIELFSVDQAKTKGTWINGDFRTN